MMETLGSSGRKSPVQTILILLVESGLVYLGFQVSHFYVLLADGAQSLKISPFCQIVYSALNAVPSAHVLEAYTFDSVFVSFSVSVGQSEVLHHV